MIRTHSRTGAVLVLLGLVALAGCSAPELDPHDPGSVALHLFALSDADPGPEELGAFFDAEQLADRSVDLLDALDGIAGSATPGVLGVQTSADAEEAFVDLELELPGAGRAVYNVKLRRAGEGGWRIAWFQGPGVEWPSRNREGASLSTSAPPELPSADW